MKKRYCFVLFIALLSSCTKNHTTSQKLQWTNTEFSSSMSMPYIEIDTDYLLSYPKCILLTDNSLIIQDDRGHKYFYHEVDRMSGLLKFEFAEKGNGPSEILSTTLNPIYNKQKQEVQYFDRDMKNYHYYNVDQHEISSSVNIRNETSIHDLYVHEFFDLGDYYLGTGMNGAFNNNRFAIFDKSLKLVDLFEEYPTFDFNTEKNKELKNMAFNINLLKISPNNKKAVYASYTIGLLEIFNLDALPNKIDKVKSLLLTQPMKGEDNIWGFEDIYATDNFIYALHNGKTADENPYYSRSIKVFDWNGEPIIEYNIGLDMRCIAIDEDNRTMYAIAYSDDKGFFLIKMEQIPHIIGR